MVICGRITCGQFLHLPPVLSSTLIALEDIGGASVGVLSPSSDHHCVSVDRYRRTEIVTSHRIARSEFFHLSPVLSSTLIALKDISRSSVGVLKPSSDHHCVDIDRYRPTELVIHCRINGCEFLHLSPVLSSTLIALEDIGRASVGVLAVSSDHHCVAVGRYRGTESVICRRIAS